MSYITEFSICDLAGSDKVYSQKLNKDVNVFFGRFCTFEDIFHWFITSLR